MTSENFRPVVGDLRRVQGEIRCLLPDCSSRAFPLCVVAKHVKVDTFDALSKCQAQLRKFSKWSWKKHNDVLVKEEVQRKLDLLLRLSEQEGKK